MVTPLKSPLDPHSYKVIELHNGLKALLITSCNFQEEEEEGAQEPKKKKCAYTPKNKQKPARKSKDCSNRTTEFDQQNTVGSSADASLAGSSLLDNIVNISKSSLNPFCPEEKPVEEFESDYPELTEKQKLRICKDSRKYDMVAYVSLCVEAGYLDDPTHMQGTAHMLEHLLLMGCSKYPDGTYFDEFLSFTGGSPWNGNTDGCRTVFYFDTSSDYLPESLDILAAHLAAPLLSPKFIAKERENVDGEFRKAIPGHNFRFNHFLQSLSTPGHPYHTFSWGNMETLGKGKTDYEVSEELKTFFTRYYSADHMYLVVQAAQTLWELEEIVQRTFEEAPIRKIRRTPLRSLPMPFCNPRFTKLYKIKAFSDIRKLMVTWQLPAEAWTQYEVKPLDYISYVLLNENVNGISDYLRSQDLIIEMSMNPTETNLERSAACTLFSVHFTLTQNGLENYMEVLLAFFSFIKMMIKEGPQFHIFSELSKIRATEFHYIREADDGLRVKELSEALRIYPAADIISGPTLIRKYDTKLLQRLTSLLVPSTANYMLFSKDFDSRRMEREHYFGIEYAENDFDCDKMRELESVKVYHTFDLPRPNPFVTTDFCSVKPDHPEDVERLLPVKLYDPTCPCDTQPVHMWFFQEGSTVAPQSTYTITFSSPVSLHSPEAAATLDIFTLILQDQFKGSIYSAANANLEVSIQRTLQGLQFRLAGFNQKLTLLLKELLLTFSNLEGRVSTKQFEDARLRIKAEYENLMMEPCLLASDTRQAVLIDRIWGVTCQYNVCDENITIEKFRGLARTFKQRLHVRAYIGGNINRSGAVDIMNLIKTTVGYQPLGFQEFPKTRVNQLPPGERCVRIQSFGTESDTSVVKNIYQVGPMDTKTRVICDYITEIIDEPMFNTLRTEKQLSYNPELIYHDDFGVMQLQVNLITQADKFSADYVNDEIDKFFEKFYELEISTLTEAKMNILRKDMILSKKLRLETPCDCEEFWEKIVSQDLDLYFLVNEIHVWETLTSKDIKNFFKKYLLRPSYVSAYYPDFFQKNQGWEFRKLSVQIIGYNAKQRKRIPSFETPDYSQLKYLSEPCRDENYFIQDIFRFKGSLCSYPAKF